MNGTTTFKRISFVQSIFNDTGLSYVFKSQFPICMSSIKSAIKQRFVINLYKTGFQIWITLQENFIKLLNKIKFEAYLIRSSTQDRAYITKLRNSNLKHRIETGRWNNKAK